MSPIVFDIVHTAITLSKSKQIKTIAALKTKLAAEFKGEDSAINEALKMIADRLASTGGLVD